MQTINYITAIFGILGTAAAIIFGYIAFERNRSRDERKEAKQDGAVLTELGYIKSGVDDIKRKQDKQEEKNIEIMTRLTTVEESNKQAHHLINQIMTKSRTGE